jgi:hypothetical protein
VTTTTLRFFIAPAAYAIGDDSSELPNATPAADRIKSRRVNENCRASSTGLVGVRLIRATQIAWISNNAPRFAGAEFESV